MEGMYVGCFIWRSAGIGTISTTKLGIPAKSEFSKYAEWTIQPTMYADSIMSNANCTICHSTRGIPIAGPSFFHTKIKLITISNSTVDSNSNLNPNSNSTWISIADSTGILTANSTWPDQTQSQALIKSTLGNHVNASS